MKVSIGRDLRALKGNAFTTGNPLGGQIYLKVSIGKGFGALKGLRHYYLTQKTDLDQKIKLLLYTGVVARGVADLYP